MKTATKKQITISYMTYEEVEEIKETINKLQHEIESLENISKQIVVIRSMEIKIRTLEGNIVMTDKDYLIVGIQGEIYPCKIDIFNKSYDMNMANA